MHEKAKYLFLALVAVLACLLVWDFIFWSGRFPPNTYIEKIDVSGLSKFEVLERLRSAEVDKSTLSPIYLKVEGKVLSYKPSELGAYISPRRTIANSTSVTYRSNYLVDFYRRLAGNYTKRTIPLALNVDRDVFKIILEGFAESIDAPVQDATFALLPEGRYRITKEKTGKKVDIGASCVNLEKAFRNNERTAFVEVVLTLPRVYAKSLVKYPPKYLLSEYTTYFGSHDSPNRVHNIKLASGRTNNYVATSGEVFSLLGMLGDFTYDSGYKEAFVLYNGMLEPQSGGGSCQIASTLYNAALLAGLDILERYNHGIYFTIYPLGRDASIYSSSRDLKIVNNTSHPIYIKAYATDRKLTYRIYGTPTARKISFSRPMVFFEGEKYRPYNVMTDEAKEKINKALLNGKPFYTYVKVTKLEAGYETEKTIVSHYKMTGDRENVKIVRPEP